MGIPTRFGDRNTPEQQPVPPEAKTTQRKSPKRDRPESEDQGTLPADTKAADVAQKKLSTHPEAPNAPQSPTPKISKAEKQAAARTDRLAARSLDKSHGQKRERPEADPEIEETASKKIPRDSVVQKSSNPEPTEVLDFPALPIDLQRTITNKLDPHTQQKLRETGHRGITETIHRYDLAQLVGFTDFLAASLQDTSFATPKESKAAILTSSLENPSEALYRERSRVLDKLIPLDSTKLEELAQEYKKPIYHTLPPKFETIFEIAKLEKTPSASEQPEFSRDLVKLDCYEYLRYLEKYANDEDKVAIVEEIASILLNNTFLLDAALNWDRETLKYMERIINSGPDKTERNSSLAHLAAGIARLHIIKGKPELALKEIAKSCTILEQFEESEEFSIFLLYSYHIDSVIHPICTNIIDEVSVRKIFETYKQSALKISDESERKKVLDYINIIEGSINLVKDWSKTTQLNQTLQLLNEDELPHSKIITIKEMLGKVGQKLAPEASKEFYERCIKRLEPTQDCYPKTELLIDLYQRIGDLATADELIHKSLQQLHLRFN